ncbi:Dentin sialophosphoprotein-related, putative isoform 3 [Hibiscus syriacus]|uniref:Dentin sialophosphoprotein-related, putative isoform 3 n=1 Tax=Hibiscus syriacus TaxID=106335 RepID=A0A6A2XKM9_HIBSY|nr:Dentin sialophosphoprotein-related, putative isoform 3 [Hibiscus syriacus]
MYRGSSKLGRGGGGGRGGRGPRNRSSFPPAPPHRPSSATQSGRLSLGSAPRNRPGIGGGSGPAPSVEESFSLVSGNNPLAFAMIIRLAPDLVEEIRRLEAQGKTARIKFDSIPTHPTGNVIDVGGKEFRFTWSREFGDLCDIYEERQMGEDGNCLLVESGCAWRKLNVQRVLDESITNQVKMRSEEAERMHKSRKAIILDHGNPSMKNQIKQLVAAEASPWKSHFKKKEIAFKKRKVDTPQAAVVAPTKSSFKSGLISAATAKGRRSSSPLPSPPERSGAAASPVGIGNTTKTHTSSEDAIPLQVKSKENISSSEKEILTRATSVVREMQERRGNFGPKPTDLQSLLISLLKENPKGMSLKARYMVVGDTIPNSARQIEPALKKIATFHAPGRYFLKPGVELESSKKSLSESGSSSEDNQHEAPAPEENQDQIPAPASLSMENVTHNEMEEQTHLDPKLMEESKALEQIDIQQHSPDLGGERKASDNSEGPVNSASDSGSDSDSDSDSSDSGSDSGSHSRSASPAASGSGSSSDSESDASSNSKEGSDEDVDIMTSDDDKETKWDMPSEPGFFTSPVPWQAEHNTSLQNGMDENQDDDRPDAVDIEGNVSDTGDAEGHGLDAVEIEKDLPEDDQETGMAANANKECEKHEEGTKPSSSEYDEFQERQNFIGNLFNDTENIIKNYSRNEKSDYPVKSKGKSKRGSDSKHIDGKPERSKRLKSESMSQPPVSGSGDAYQSSNKGDKEHADSQKGYNQVFPRKSSKDFHQSGRKSSDPGAQTKAFNTAERHLKHSDRSEHGSKFTEKNVTQNDNPSRDTQNEDGLMKEKNPLTNPKGDAGGINVVPSDFHYRKHGETVVKFKDAGQISGSYINSSPKDNSRVSEDRYPANGKSNILQRELSNLELGEIREPVIEETPTKKQFERKGSFKQSGSRPSASENSNPDLGRGKPIEKTNWNSGKTSSPNVSGLKRTPEHLVDDLSRSHHRDVQSQQQQLTRFDFPEVVSQLNKLADNSKTKQTDTGAKIGVGLEYYSESQKKAPACAPQQKESKRGSVSQFIKGSKIPTSNKLADMTDTRKDVVQKEGNVNGQNKRGSSSDEHYLPYFKYEKDEPERRGPIKDSSQYEEYVNEFREKYQSYKDLDKVLQTYRNEFEKLGKDLEYSKGRDKEKYYKTLDQLMESYHQCGTRHKRLKKIFVVLHQELKNLKQRLVEYAESH